MQEDWFLKKFVNPRTVEGSPQTEQIRYAKELFEAFGMTDTEFSGASIAGSTMKGYGSKESSDIDVAFFYCDKNPLQPFVSETPFLEKLPGCSGLDFE